MRILVNMWVHSLSATVGVISEKMTLADGTTFIDPHTLTDWMDDLTGLSTVQWPRT